MSSHKALFLPFLFALISASLFSQETFQIRDLKSNEIVPFVKVYPKSAAPFLADIDGKFVWMNDWITVRLTSMDYRDTTFVKSETTGSQLYLTSKVQEVQEVNAVAGENPAHRIMEQVIKNKSSNNPLDNDAFKYKSYTKFLTEVDESVLSAISDTTTDSSLIETRNFIRSSHIFLIETSSIRTFVPPSRDKEEVIAYKVSGFQDPLFATIAKELQSFSFYENQFSILEKTYINPIALGGIRRYLFILQDTTYIGNDTLFHIAFRPRKGKNFDGLKGTLFINTNGYAVERVIAEPAETAGNTPHVKILQEYQFIQGKKWFPVKLSSELIFKNISFTIADSVVTVISKSNTYIDSVELNPEKVKKYYFDNAAVIIDVKASDVADSTWTTLRKYELTDKEKNTYKTIDSLVKEEKLDRLLYAFKVLSTGKIPLKYFNVDLARLMGYNEYEGFRLGLGLETSEKLFKPATLGGYFAYGFRDKAFKWGGDLSVFLYPKKALTLKLSYRDDVFERGGKPLLNELSGFTSTSQIRSFYTRYMDRNRQAFADLSFFASSNFRIGVVGKYERVSFLQGYVYSPTASPSEPSVFFSELDNFTFTSSVLWRIREKVMMVGNQRVSLGTKFPTIYLSITQALPKVGYSQLDYTRSYAEISQKFQIRGVGLFRYQLAFSDIQGTVPLAFSHGLYNSFSVKNQINLSIPETIETLDNVGYFFKQSASLITRFELLKWKVSKNFQPQLGFHHALFFGNAIANDSVTLQHNQTIYGLEKGHFEGGLYFNRLFSSLGAGVFYRYGPYSSAYVKNNLVVKVTYVFAF